MEMAARVWILAYELSREHSCRAMSVTSRLEEMALQQGASPLASTLQEGWWLCVCGFDEASWCASRVDETSRQRNAALAMPFLVRPGSKRARGLAWGGIMER